MERSRSGQSFVELMIAIAIGAIFMGGMATIIAPSLIESGQAEKIQTAATNAQSLITNVRVWSEGSWNNILSLSTGTASQYYLITSSSPYTATSGIQSVVLGTTTYTDYFYLGDVYRTSAGSIATSSSGNTYDPSTKQVVAVYDWTPHGVTNTISTYITRNEDAVFDQTDWSGGPSPNSVVTSTDNQFASSSNIDYASTTGAIYIAISGSGGGGGTSGSGQNIWVADSDNNRVEEFSATGAYEGQIGCASGACSAGSGNGEFGNNGGSGYIQDLVVDSSGNIWVVDAGNNRVEEFSATDAYEGQIGCASGGCTDESDDNGQLYNPWGIAIDSNGNIWVADSDNDRVEEFSATGTYESQFGSYGSGNGEFSDPWGIAIDSSNNIWVADASNNRIEEFSATGTYEGKFGSYGSGNGKFSGPTGIAIDSSGNIWVTDSNNGRIEKFSATGTYEGKFGTSGTGELDNPQNIAIDSSGNLWVTDEGNSRIVEFSATGTYESQFGSYGSGNGEFDNPEGITWQ